MIHMKIMRHSSEGIKAFHLCGHAQFAEKGQDIVCAAVSGISFGTLNAIEQLLKIELVTEMDEETGLLRCIVPHNLEQPIHEKVQLLLEGMVVSLQSVQAEYGEYLSLEEKIT